MQKREKQMVRHDPGESTPYLLNCWYAGAWSDELDAGPVGRMLLDRHVALFRDNAGTAHAVGGRCPHRFAPLAQGKVVADGSLQCPYHGLRFSGDGRCVHNPHDDEHIPDVSLPTWPVCERYGMAWIWFADPGQADPALVPDFSFMDETKWEIIKGVIHGKGNYQLFTDNILDLSHAEYIHSGLSAPAFVIGQRRYHADGTAVWCHIEHPNYYVSDVMAVTFDVVGRKQNFWTDIRWTPPTNMLLVPYLNEPDGPRETARAAPSLHIMTPESKSSTFYFWAVGRETRLNDPEFTEQMRAGFLHAFENEDKPMIARQQVMMEDKDFWDLRPVVLKSDTGAVMARRKLLQLLREERDGIAVSQ